MAELLFTHSFFLRLDPKQWRAMQPYAPLATLYAASYLREKGFRVAFFDPVFAASPQELQAPLKQHRPGLVVLHEDNFNWLSKMCLVRMRQAAFEMLQLSRQVPGTPPRIIVAGSDATDRQDLYCENGADFAILGESEATLEALAGRLLRGAGPAPAGIPGLAFPVEGEMLRTAARGYLKDLDDLPFPAWDLADIPAYRAAWRRRHGYFSMNMVTTRGCPFRCNWCAKPIFGSRYNSRSPENVIEELLYLQSTFHPDHVWFADDIFGLKPGWVEKFGELAVRKQAGIPFKIQARVDLLTRDVVAGLKKAGCRTVWVGAESGSQKVLDAMDKGTTVAQIYAAADLLKQHGIEVCFFLQFGYPGETDEDIERTIRMVRACSPDDIGISVSYPLPGTKFYDRVREQLGRKQNWEHSDDLALMFAGRYRPAFYRQLHRVVHQDYRLHRAGALFSEIWRHPAKYTISNLRTLVAAAAHAPLLPLARARLARLRQPNRAAV